MSVSFSHRCDGVTPDNGAHMIEYDPLESEWTLLDGQAENSLYCLNFCPFCGCWLDDELNPEDEPVNRMPKTKPKPGAWTPK